MKLFRLSMAILLSGFLIGCGNNNINSPRDTIKEKTEEEIVVEKDEKQIETQVEEKSELVKSEILDSSVENNPPETNYLPSFEGQTRVNGVKTMTEYSFKEFAKGFNEPWGIAVLPDGNFVVTEKIGSLRILSSDGDISEEIAGLPEVDSSGQGGLLDVKASLDFSNSRILYFTFSEPSSQGTLTAVGRGRLSHDYKSIEDFEVIFRALPYYKSSGHYGSRIAIDKEGNLFISTGDRMDSSNRMRVQALDNGHGKILHITSDGNSISGTPFESEIEITSAIYSFGHRNVQGLDIHPESGELWASEMGPRGGDELNLILQGKNYGWPIISYGIEYSGTKVGEGITEKENMEQPVYYWDPVLAPSGMTFYYSDEIPEWKNNLFIGGLRSQHIARIIIEDDKVVGEERLLSNLGERFRDLEVGLDGAIYALTDGGTVYRIGE